MATSTIKDHKLSVTSFTGSNGLKISKNNHLAVITVFPTKTTTSSSAVVDTITDSTFRPNADIDFATKVYNGSSYVDCWLRIAASSGAVSIVSATGGTVAGYQAQYCKAKGITFFCNG